MRMRESSAASILVCMAGIGMYLMAACAGGDTVETGFQELTGSGGSSSSGGGMGGTTTVTSASSGIISTGSSSPTTATGPGSTNTTSSTGSGMVCNDTGPGEPNNDTEANAVDLGAINDNDSMADSVSGIINGDGDVDWYRYAGADEAPFPGPGGCADPFREVTGSTAGARFCKFIECANGGEDISCPDGTTAATSPGGRPGCCTQVGAGLIHFDGGSLCIGTGFNCAGGDDSALIYFRIDQGEPTSCDTYTIDYHF